MTYDGLVFAAEKFRKAGDLKEAIEAYSLLRNIDSSGLEHIRHCAKYETPQSVAEGGTYHNTNLYVERMKDINRYRRIVERLQKVRAGKWHGLEGKTD